MKRVMRKKKEKKRRDVVRPLKKNSSKCKKINKFNGIKKKKVTHQIFDHQHHQSFRDSTASNTQKFVYAADSRGGICRRQKFYNKSDDTMCKKK